MLDLDIVVVYYTSKTTHIKHTHTHNKTNVSCKQVKIQTIKCLQNPKTPQRLYLIMFPDT